MNAWRVSQVTNMTALFSGAQDFNEDLSAWDVSAATEMAHAFSSAKAFNADVSSWDVRKVTNMASLFESATAFNTDISAWNVSSVTNMTRMFANNYAFRGDLAAWDVSRVRSLERAFFAAEAFDGDLSGWNVSRVTNMRGAFQRASAFDADLSSWEVARVTTMQNMFTKALAFKGKNISSWDVGQVTTMRHMFVLAGEFEGNLSSWNVEKVTDMEKMFRQCVAFRGDVSRWNVSQVTDMSNMFQEAIVFNSDLSSWDIAKVTDLSQILSNAASFNQDLCNWSEKIDSKGYVSNYMFKGSNCTFQADPEEDRGGPFCASTCKTAAVVWSMSSDSHEPAAACKAPVTSSDHASGIVLSDGKELTVPTRSRSRSVPSTSDCFCNGVTADYISKPFTDCSSYIQCSGGHMVQELSCPDKMIFDSKVQACNWEVECANNTSLDLASFENDTACQCEYARTLCTRSLQDLTAETISTWAIPFDCVVANDVCSIGDDLFQNHTTEICTQCIQPACEAEGNPLSQSCMDHVTHCCSGASSECQCHAIQAACERGNTASCSTYADACCTDAECRCDYHKMSCSLSLETAEEGAALSQYCLDAEDTCCPGCSGIQMFQAQDVSSCQCSCKVWDQLCSSNPGPAHCLLSAGRCCGSPDDATHNSQCYCEMGEFLDQNMNYDLLDYSDSCSRAKEAEFLSDSTTEREALEHIFNELGGEDWFNEDNMWLNNATEHCSWFGVTCDSTARYIVKLDLTANNLVGTMNSRLFASFSKLESLVLAGNQLQGAIDFNSFYDLRRLKHVDISKNNLNGDVDVLLSPVIQYLNLSHNKFSSLVHFKFRGSQTTLEQLDLSHNNITQDASRVLENLPASLKELVLTDNHIYGSLPNPLPVSTDLLRFIVDDNAMTGRIPDLSRSFPRLQELDLSNQRHAMNRGLSGPIPTGMNLPDLVILDVSKNKLTNAIPSDIGSLPKLKKLFLSHNKLTGSIPASFGEQFNTSQDAFVELMGNADMVAPAPLDLCYVPGFDLRNDPTTCPPERYVLNEFYYAAKGREWTESDKWTLQQNDHCSWYGVTCNKGFVTELILRSNGLSGKLDSRISELSFLEVLDLSDNDIKGNIPSEIGHLLNLKSLRLSYNSFVGFVPVELDLLKSLTLLHLHSNRLLGNISLSFLSKNESSFVSDCGIPSSFESPVLCESCTMCCNAHDDCFFRGEILIEKVGFDGYMEVSYVFLLCTVSGCIVLQLVMLMYRRFKDSQQLVSAEPKIFSEPLTSTLIIEKELKEAREMVGNDSVYKFFLGQSTVGWMMSFLCIGVQLWIAYEFVLSSEFEGSISDLVYMWNCPRDQVDCRNTDARNWRGWVFFAVLMTSHLLKDMINGSKLVILSGKARSPLHLRVKYFIGGLSLILASSFIMFASTVYNRAIATSNTDLVANAVIILFIVDIDEMMHSILVTINPNWADNEEIEEDGDASKKTKEEVKSLLEEDIKIEVKKQVQVEVEKIRVQLENVFNEQLKKCPQTMSSNTPAIKAAQDKIAVDSVIL